MTDDLCTFAFVFVFVFAFLAWLGQRARERRSTVRQCLTCGQLVGKKRYCRSCGKRSRV